MECSICFENTDEISLECGHKIHHNCLKKLLKSNAQKKCPMCRVPITLEKFNNVHNFNLCHCCNEKIDLESINYIKNLTCGCVFHFNCFNEQLKKEDIKDCREKINCPSCRVETDRYYLEAHTYLQFYESMINWVGMPPRCKFKDCRMLSSPRTYFFCKEHLTIQRTNRSFYKGLKYIFKYASTLDEKDRMEIFCKIVEMWDDNIRNINYLPYNKWIEII